MNDALSLFDPPEATNEPTPKLLMTDSQRTQIRAAFAALGTHRAREQFDVVEQLTGQKISSVTELERRHAHNLILGLQRRLDSIGSQRSGNAWTDREEDTWIDKL